MTPTKGPARFQKLAMATNKSLGPLGSLFKNVSQFSLLLMLQQGCMALLSNKWCLALIPCFLGDIIRPERRRRAPQLHATSYLDGLRGLASFTVFAFHYTDYNHKFFLNAYGANSPGFRSSFLQLPFIRIVYAGPAMVHTFFVVSGFALSYRPLKCLYDQAPSLLLSQQSKNHRARSIAKCHGILASSALRRPIRLFGPPLTFTFIEIGLISMGFMRNFLRPKSTWLAQFSDWAGDAVNAIAWPWGWDDNVPRSHYNPHLWTIPVEFFHSILLFLVLLVVSQMRTALLRRVTLTLAMAYALLVYGRWAAFEFLGGALLADLHLSEETLEQTGLDKRVDSIFFAKTLVLIHCLVLAGAGYIISWPPAGTKPPIYAWLQLHSPSSFSNERGDRFWFALAAFGIVWACGRLGMVKRFLESDLVQYTGRISFAFYIIQHSFLNICELPVLGATFKPATPSSLGQRGWGVRGLVGQSTASQRTACWFIGLCVLGFFLVCIADVFSRTVDVLFIKAARRFENIMFIGVKEDSQDRELTLATK
jgi:peptidoglycan/LPS O-acetylase OafA/YrhL